MIGPVRRQDADSTAQVVDPYLTVAVIDDVLFRCIVLVCGTGARPVSPCFLLVGFSNPRQAGMLQRLLDRSISLPNHHFLG